MCMLIHYQCANRSDLGVKIARLESGVENVSHTSLVCSL